MIKLNRRGEFTPLIDLLFAAFSFAVGTVMFPAGNPELGVCLLVICALFLRLSYVGVQMWKLTLLLRSRR